VITASNLRRGGQCGHFHLQVDAVEERVLATTATSFDYLYPP
jgi:hypothetical protein